MTGSGNDFVMVDGRATEPGTWSTADIRAVCARGTGIGADGLVFVSPGAAPGAVRMVYFNSDGSRAAMCGNAALCSTQFATRLGLASGHRMSLETDAGTYESRCGPGERAELHLAAVQAPQPVPGLSVLNGEGRTALGLVGVPHLVVLVDEVDGVDLPLRGRSLRFDPALGADGANVNFISPAGPTNAWRMRTYERGVEGETLACGTGAVAAACAIHEWGLGSLPVTILSRSGRTLEIRARKAPGGLYDDVWLVGEARLVFRGVIA
jgi:diaminopimelate epimerase